MRVAGRSVVDEVLKRGSVDHGARFEGETTGNAGDRGEWDVEALAEGGVQETRGEREGEEDGDGVEVGEEVVGEAMGLGGGGLGDEVCVHLGLAEPVDGEGESVSAHNELEMWRSRFLITEMGMGGEEGG